MPTLANTEAEYWRQTRFTVIMTGGTDASWYERQLLTCEIPSVTIDGVELWDGTANNRVMTRAIFDGPVSMSFYMQEGDTDPFFKWISEHADFEKGEGPGKPLNAIKIKSSKSYKRNLIIRVLSGDYSPVAEWTLWRVQIQNATFDRLDYTSEGNPIVVTMNIVPDRVTYYRNA